VGKIYKAREYSSFMKKGLEFPGIIDARWRIQVPIELRTNLEKGKEEKKTYRVRLEEL
jgi:hypothetical protein